MSEPARPAAARSPNAARTFSGALLGLDAAVRRDRTAARVAILTGVVFVLAGLFKFVFHGFELKAFRMFGLPWAPAFVILAGVLETAGGVLLALRLLVAPTALLLALTMIVAIVVSGFGHDDVIPSLTLAPALLVAMLFLLGRGLRPARPQPS